MTTLFISDVHLDERRPQTTALLLDFLQQAGSYAQAIYILGDLFEYWLGDDLPMTCATELAGCLAVLSKNGLPCFFIHGNRDFLVGDTYAEQAGLTLLPQESVINLYGESVLLMHGDSLCTDDIAYQNFRERVRNPRWQQQFLAKPPSERLQMAMQARDASTTHKEGLLMGETGTDIMDVNQSEVMRAFARHGVHKLIHGHTHRPAIHTLQTGGQSAQRYVLGDWYSQGSVLKVSPSGYELQTLQPTI